jgi:hypothetical protein
MLAAPVVDAAVVPSARTRGFSSELKQPPVAPKPNNTANQAVVPSDAGKRGRITSAKVATIDRR